MTCPTCGRVGLCAECCCVNPSHHGTTPRQSCPLCHHDIDRRRRTVTGNAGNSVTALPARDVVAWAVESSGVMPSNGNEQQDRFTSLVVADAVLAALREHWASNDEVLRVAIAVNPGLFHDPWCQPEDVRAVVAALFEEES